ncbi:peptidase [Aliikangiella marina]|uniref:Peptidase n=1 Tax=Aliikangiella marina TaxID=1712262 RepID=A0A545TJH6_9GAMM|nr:Type 1 glutamine amidotransferase-like domain-containing protein [Aliikangiella marina]TQV77384.1 peptidase [Aliikangiella marina]
MSEHRKSLYLLADSQLLFWNIAENRFIESIRENLDTKKASITKAAYIGAANGDKPEFFELFKAAMDNIDLHESRMITSQYSKEEQEFLESADLILLAGGDIKVASEILEKTGMAKTVIEKYYSGAVLIGISAGAIQLGLGIANCDGTLIEGLKLLPYFVEVSEKESNWNSLKKLLASSGQYNKGFGLSAGGGMIYHSDMTIEPLRNSIVECRSQSDDGVELGHNVLLPPQSLENNKLLSKAD